jgi:hypothetical protein
MTFYCRFVSSAHTRIPRVRERLLSNRSSVGSGSNCDLRTGNARARLVRRSSPDARRMLARTHRARRASPPIISRVSPPRAWRRQHSSDRTRVRPRLHLAHEPANPTGGKCAGLWEAPLAHESLYAPGRQRDCRRNGIDIQEEFRHFKSTFARECLFSA